jgi:outer membrane protein
MSTRFTKLALPLLVASTFSAFSLPVAALDAGDWLVRGRIININPSDDSENATSNGIPVPGTTVTVDDAFTLDIDITYMFTQNIGAELLLDIPTKHDVSSEGPTLASLAPGNILSTRVLPPSLLLQYHFLPNEQVRPYVGAGLNFTYFFDEEATASLDKGLGGVTDLELDSSFGWAVQAGVDFDMGNDWFINADVKYIDINTTASFKSGALGNVEVDVDINPWVLGLGVGRRF